MKVYLAGPLFSEAERAFNRKVKDFIESSQPEIEVFLPQTIPYTTPRQVFRDCFEHLHSSRVVVAILDGAQADDGTSFECGLAGSILNMKVIGLRTDTRQTGDTKGYNAMLFEACDFLVEGDNWREQLITILKELHKWKR